MQRMMEAPPKLRARPATPAMWRQDWSFRTSKFTLIPLKFLRPAKPLLNI